LFFVDSFPAAFANARNDGAPKSALREEFVDVQPADKAQVTAMRAERPDGAEVGPSAERPAGPPICALTLPQQIADHLGHRIMNGECRPGSRLKEEEFAEAYSVSRGPVREAFRILERRGFVEIVPRHGARVRAFDPADLASLFSVRAVLFGLAAREATERRSSELIGLLAVEVARLIRSAETMDISPREHAVIAGDAQHLIARFSGNRPLLRMLEEITGRALWRMAWTDPPLDLTTRTRRLQSARFWSDLLAAIRSGDAERADRTARSLLEASRDNMIAAMAALRPELAPELAVEAD
jgi:DNA-binding GntR family transcriptional regulator